MSETSTEASQRSIDKAAIDAMDDGSWLIHSERPDFISAAAFSDAIDRMLGKMEKESLSLDLRALRYVLLTSALTDRTKEWQRNLGRPETGVSQQIEGVVAAKVLSWGKDGNTARTIILVDDALAAAAAMDMSVAVSTMAHEFGHVSDYFRCGLLYGFSERPPVMTHDWPGICREMADSIWGEYAAESIAFHFMNEQALREFRNNDALHLSGIEGRVRESVSRFKRGELPLAALWSGSITNLFDLLTNLGRAAARTPPAESDSVFARYLARGVELWTPIIENLRSELRRLRADQYQGWSLEPFNEIELIVERAFRSLGLIPEQNSDGLRVRVV